MATPGSALKTETYIPPLDLYLAGCTVREEARRVRDGATYPEQFRGNCTESATPRKLTRPTEYHNGATEWASGWLATDLAEVDRKARDAITKE
jgi:hypothetical protein